ncbi:PTS trehalose transporter subunit IIBC [Orbaceae bacterium ESL0727]|nr:PTS trehalose transporter subunit IIBC [Orbaceae bacterium ESL0727]
MVNQPVVNKDSVNREMVQQLIHFVGGKKNVASVTHCLTRLRFVLNNPASANIEKIKALPFVKGCFITNGQFQVIIGTNVDEYYKVLIEQLGISEASKEETKSAAKKNMPWYERLIANLAEIFVPLLPALIAGGLLLGLRNIIGEMPTINNLPLTATYHWLQPIYDMLWLPCEAIFHFLPVAICWSTVKKMGGSPVLGIVLGITLVSPQLMNAYQIGIKLPETWDFGWFVIEKVGYQAQVIPSIFAGLALGWLETRLRKIIPNYLHIVVVPIVALLVSVFLAHVILGPLGRQLGDGVAYCVKFLMTGNFAPIGAALFGFFYAPLVITGIHHTTLAIDLQMINSMGGTPIWPIIALSNIAQASAVVGIILVSKKENEREISVPAAIAGYLGVTEPAMYGINLRYKFPMLCAMIGASAAGLICGLFGVLSNGIGVGGLPGILSIQPIYWLIYACAMSIAIVVPIILTILVYKIKLTRGTLDL